MRRLGDISLGYTVTDPDSPFPVSRHSEPGQARAAGLAEPPPPQYAVWSGAQREGRAGPGIPAGDQGLSGQVLTGLKDIARSSAGFPGTGLEREADVFLAATEPGTRGLDRTADVPSRIPRRPRRAMAASGKIAVLAHLVSTDNVRASLPGAGEGRSPMWVVS